MANEIENELLEEDEGEGEVVTLVGDNGEETDFWLIATIAHNEQEYAVMQPVELPEDMGEDEAFVFKITANADGDEMFEMEMDDAIIDAVFEKYNAMVDEEDAEEE